MKNLFRVGERVMRPALVGKRDDVDKYGEVIKVYNGAPSAIDKGVPLVDVKFDDGTVGVGFINGSSGLEREPLRVPTVVML